MRGRQFLVFPLCEPRNEKLKYYCPWNKNRPFNYYVICLIKLLLSRNFCQKNACVRGNFHNAELRLFHFHGIFTKIPWNQSFQKWPLIIIMKAQTFDKTWLAILKIFVTVIEMIILIFSFGYFAICSSFYYLSKFFLFCLIVKLRLNPWLKLILLMGGGLYTINYLADVVKSMSMIHCLSEYQLAVYSVLLSWMCQLSHS